MVYDEFQQKSIDYISKGYSVLVCAPTGAGKTVIAEYVIRECLSHKEGVIYTAPIKALSNQKFRDFQENYKDKIGILTGDVSINPTAPVLIMTTEIFRNKVLEEKDTLEKYRWIIFDEVHYLDDYERGTVWEESIIFLPNHMKLLALSATIPNINKFADWIRSILKQPIKVVKEDKRPVPLHFFYQCNGQIIDNLNLLYRIGYKENHIYWRRDESFKYQKHRQNRPTTLIKHLKDTNRLPCIYFTFGRRRCEDLAEELLQFNFVGHEEKEKITYLYLELCRKFGLSGEKSAAILKPLIEKGVAYHHAGMLPTLKEIVERLFTSRLIKVIFTTETFALGINMPARTVVFDELRKFYGRFYATLKTRDFYQMAGRAGRRGIDAEGYVYSRINPHQIKFSEIKKIIYNEPEEVKSRFNASYATLLNLYEKYQEALYDIYPLSFHYFQEKETRRKSAIRNLKAKVNLLKELAYIRKNQLTPIGMFARKIYGYELPLTEIYKNGLLEDFDEFELAIICLALVYEPRKGISRPRLSRRIKNLKRFADDIVKHIQKKEKKYGIYPISKNFYFHLSECMEAWMQKQKFEKLLTYADVDEGELIRYFRMSLQILREILDTPAEKILKAKVSNTIQMINRDIIDAERQLRIE